MASSNRDDRVERLVEANVPALLAFFLRRSDDPADAADLLGETLLVVWRKAKALPEHDDEARMWMFGVARKVIATHRRGKQRHHALHDRLREQLGTKPDSTETDTSELTTALKQLDPLDLEIIRLVHWDGFTQAEIARLLQLPEGTVRSRHHRARQHLRRLLRSSTTCL